RFRAALSLEVYGHRADADRIFQHLVDSVDIIALPDEYKAPRHALRLYDQLLLALAHYNLGHLSVARTGLADVELALGRDDPSAKASLYFEPDFPLRALGT